jgi:prolyl oligopeptidase
MKLWLVCALALMSPTPLLQPPPLKYPPATKVDQVDDFFGTKVADPYRWLEDADSADTRAWIEAENKLTFGFLEKIPERTRIRERLTGLWNYERYDVPSREGPYYIFSKNDGLQDQAVVYRAASRSRRTAG